MRDKLYTTRQVLHQCLVHPNMNIKATLNDNDAYMTVDELFEPLQKMYDSLIATGDESVANARLLDLIRQVGTFGLSMMRLDIRQESTRHSDVVDTITRYLGIGSYNEWTEEQRLEFLLKELQSKRPLFPPGMDKTPEVN